jgi:hypothetical protein
MATKKKTKPEKGCGARSGGGREASPAAPGATTDRPAPALDEARHAAAQRAAYQADVMRETLFAALMAEALGYDNLFESKAYKVFLQRLVDDAGAPSDPVAIMLLQQLATAHYRIAQLQVCAAKAKGLEATKIYNAAACRLLGEFRRTALGLRAYRIGGPEGKSQQRLKILKAAQ